MAVGAGSFHHVFDVGAGCNFGTRCGALLFQLAVVDRVGVIGTWGNVGNLVAGGIDAAADANNVTDYSIDLAQDTKDDIQKGVDAKTTVDSKGLTFNGDSGSTNVENSAPP